MKIRCYYYYYYYYYLLLLLFFFIHYISFSIIFPFYNFWIIKNVWLFQHASLLNLPCLSLLYFISLNFISCFLILFFCFFAIFHYPFFHMLTIYSTLLYSTLLIFFVLFSSFSSGYEVPFVCRLDEVSKLYDEKVLTTDEMKFEIDRLLRRDSTRLHGNDPFAMT